MRATAMHDRNGMGGPPSLCFMIFYKVSWLLIRLHLGAADEGTVGNKYAAAETQRSAKILQYGRTMD